MSNLKRMLLSMLLCLSLALAIGTVLPFFTGRDTAYAATVKLNKKKVTLLVKQSVKLKLKNTSVKPVWSSNNETVATVTSAGYVTAKRSGAAVITAKAGTKNFECTIVVEKPKMSETKVKVEVGQKVRLSLQGTTATPKWSSSNKKVAKIIAKGVARAKKVGTCKIYAQVRGRKYICTVEVVKKGSLKKGAVPLTTNKAKVLTPDQAMALAWKKLLAEGLTEKGAAGVMGNIYYESAGFYSNRLEFRAIREIKAKTGITWKDETYTDAVDSGVISKQEFLYPPTGKQYGYGLCQWTYYTRKAALYELCKKKNVSISDTETQIEFLILELKNNYPTVFNYLKSKKCTVQGASNKILIDFERPSNTGSAMQKIRGDKSKQIYEKFRSKDKDKDEDTAK